MKTGDMAVLVDKGEYQSVTEGKEYRIVAMRGVYAQIYNDLDEPTTMFAWRFTVDNLFAEVNT